MLKPWRRYTKVAAARESAASSARSGRLIACGKVLAPIQERRQKYDANPRLAWDILEAGSAKARVVAEATMIEARDAANLSHEYEAPVESVSVKANDFGDRRRE